MNIIGKSICAVSELAIEDIDFEVLKFWNLQFTQVRNIGKVSSAGNNFPLLFVFWL